MRVRQIWTMLNTTARPQYMIWGDILTKDVSGNGIPPPVCSLTAAARPRRWWSCPPALGMRAAPPQRCCHSLCRGTALPVRNGEAQLLPGWHLVESWGCKETLVTEFGTVNNITGTFISVICFGGMIFFFKEENISFKTNYVKNFWQVHGQRTRHLFYRTLSKCS